MAVSSFFILQINLQDTDITDRESAKVLLYVNGVLDAVMTFQDQNDTTLFVHENDQLTLELQRANRSFGETRIHLRSIDASETLKWVKFQSNAPKAPMVMLRMQAFRIGTDNIEEYQVQHLLNSKKLQQSEQRSLPRQQSTSPHHCELCKGKARNGRNKSPAANTKLIDINELVAEIQTELRRMKQLLKSDPDERSAKPVRKLLLETQKIQQAILLQRKHWCKHCVLMHLQDHINRFREIQRIVGSMAHHLDDAEFYNVLNKAHSLAPSDSMNDRGSPIRYPKTSVKGSSTKQTPKQESPFPKDFVLARLIERIQGRTGNSYPDLNPLETLEVLVEDLIKQNEGLKVENMLLSDMLNEERQRMPRETSTQLRESTLQKVYVSSPQSRQEMQNSFALSFSNTRSFKEPQTIESIHDEDKKHNELKELFEQRERVINELMDKWTGDVN